MTELVLDAASNQRSTSAFRGASQADCVESVRPLLRWALLIHAAVGSAGHPGPRLMVTRQPTKPRTQRRLREARRGRRPQRFLACTLPARWSTNQLLGHPAGTRRYVVGFFKRKEPRRSEASPSQQTSAPIDPAPSTRSCVCGATVPTSDFADHLDTHIVVVTLVGGHPGRSYECPLCGPTDEAYGNPGEHPISLRNMSHALFRRHCEQAHGVKL